MEKIPRIMHLSASEAGRSAGRILHHCRLLVFALLLVAISARAEDISGGLRLRQNQPVTLGQRIVIEARGEIANKILAEAAKGTASQKFSLYLDGIEIPGLRASHAVPDVEAWQAKNPGAKGTPPEVELTFVLERNSENDASRKAWDAFLRTRQTFDGPVEVAISVSDEAPIKLNDLAQFHAGSRWRLNLAWLVGAALFALIFILVGARSNMLLDDDGHFSLARTQMAFWGALVLSAWVGVAVFSGSMEHIPAQTLILLGISATTAVGAAIIGGTTKPARVIAPARKSFADFFTDLVTVPGKGANFHRLQTALWTIVLGMFFVWNVFQTMSMPEFSETLLVLLGISNGTYLTLKTKE